MATEPLKPASQDNPKLSKPELAALANFLYARFEKSKLQNKQHKRNNKRYEA